MTYPYLDTEDAKAVIHDAIIIIWQHLRTNECATKHTLPVLLETVKVYEDRTRAYHGVTHIAYGIEEILKHWDQFEDPILTLYMWLNHDRVFILDSKLNEVWSANLARDDAMKIGFSGNDANIAHAGVLATKEHVVPGEYPGAVHDLELLLDIDLSPLGFPHDIFITDGEKIQAEAGGVMTDEMWSEGRGAFAKDMLTHTKIYLTRQYRHLESVARENLAWAITDAARTAV